MDLYTYHTQRLRSMRKVKDILDETGVELQGDLRANNSALQADGSASDGLKRGQIDDLRLFTQS